MARQALEAFASISGLTFFEVAPDEGDIRFSAYDFDLLLPGMGGFAYYPSGAHDRLMASDVFVDYDSAGSTHLLLHEIGHTLGLKHTFEGSVTLRPDLDHYGTSVMSYTAGGHPGNVLGPFDVQAVQHLYAGAGDDGKQVASWSWNAATRTLSQTGSGIAETILGVGSADIISGLGGDDVIEGRGGNDRLEGGDGADKLRGSTGDDTLIAGIGDDTLDGGEGNDRLEGGDNNDSFFGGLGDDTMIGGAGNDSIFGFEDADRVFGDAGNDTVYGGSEGDRIEGGADNDSLYGESGDDALYGDGGNDFLSGGEGRDTLSGGAGDDSLSDLFEGRRPVPRRWRNGHGFAQDHDVLVGPPRSFRCPDCLPRARPWSTSKA